MRGSRLIYIIFFKKIVMYRHEEGLFKAKGIVEFYKNKYKEIAFLATPSFYSVIKGGQANLLQGAEGQVFELH